MWPRFNKNDVKITAHYLGMLMMLFGVIMLVPLAVALFYCEWSIATHYVLGAGIALTLGALLHLAKIEPQRMGRKHAIAVTGMIWIIGAVLAAVPLYLSGQFATLLDAIFEGVSGLTATGLSLAQDVDHMSMADNMWRFTMQYIGGQGVVVVALSLGIFTRTGNALYTSEAREESVVPNVKNTARFILYFSAAAVLLGTVVITAILILKGMEPSTGFFHGLWITIGAYDTGGFAPGSLSLIPYHSWPLEIVAMLLMMFGALSFAVVAQVNKGNWREFVRDIEVRTLAIWTTVMVVVFVAALASGDFLTDFSGLMRRGVFTIVSATTNTGFQVLSTEQITTLFSSGAFLLVAIAMAVGGSSASTAGGIKALRVGLIFKGIGLSIRKILQPRSAHITSHYNHIGRHQLAPELLSSALIIAALYVISYMFGALIGIAYGYEALHAIFESISAASNAGLSSGIIKPGMPAPLEALYILQMWLGRLEFITLLALLASFIASLIPRRKPKVEEPRDAKNFTNTQGRAKSLFIVVLALLATATVVFTPLQRAHAATDGSAYGSVEASTGSSAYGSVAAAFDASAYGSVEASTDGSAEAPQGQPVEPREATISELAVVPEHLDNTTVVFVGEVVGSSIYADTDHVWVTLSDGNSAMSVYLPREYLNQIEHFGNYAFEGTQIKLVGEFRLSCYQHDGASDVHASTVVEVVQTGAAREHEVNFLLLAAGFVLILVGAGLLVLYRVLRAKRR